MVKLELNGTKRYVNSLMFQMVSDKGQYCHLTCLVYIKKVEKWKFCFVCEQFYCVLVYTDCLKLFAASLTVLQSMVDTCKSFDNKNGLNW